MFVFFYEEDLRYGKSWIVFYSRKHYRSASKDDRTFYVDVITQTRRDSYENLIKKGSVL